MTMTLDIGSPRERLASALPALQLAATAARGQMPDGEVSLAIVVKNKTSGRVVCTFDAASFLQDLEEILGVEPETAVAGDGA
jgi:hypothetical protein